MFLIVGLGNPGEEYVRTRHNVGFFVLDALTGKADWQYDKYVKARYWKGEWGNTSVLFLQPHTFMNLSGEAVKAVLSKEDVSLDSVVVIYDDIDLPLGTYKISFDRGAGGHNGIKSMISSVGDSAFLRIRIGIAPVSEDGAVYKPKDTADFVLKEFSKGDIEKIESLIPSIKEALVVFMKDGKEVMMNKFN
jgi:PTH1 family peptidyl-tRNA hydrolase